MHFFNVTEYLSLQNIIILQNKIMPWIACHFFTTIVLYFFLFFLSHIFNLPTSIIAPILAGYFLPFWIANSIGVVSLTCAFIAYYMFAQYLTKKSREWNWLAIKTKSITTHFLGNKLFYLFTMRFIPFPGNNLIPLVAAQANLSYLEYTAWSVLGTIPIVGIYTYLGGNLAHLITKGASSWRQLMWEPQAYIPMLFFIIISLVSPIRQIILKFSTKKYT